MRQRLLDARQERRAVFLAAEQRTAVAGDAARIAQDGGERADDLADVAAELALGIPELGRLQSANRAHDVVARDRLRDEARRGGRREAETVAHVLETLTRAVAGLQRDDRAANRVGDLPGAGTGELGQMAALAALLAQAGIGGAELGALRHQLGPVPALELPLPSGGGGDRFRQALLVPRAAFDRALHGLAEIIGFLGEGEKALAVAVERGSLDPRAARDDGDHLDVLEQRLEQRRRLRRALADRLQQRAFRRQRPRQLA